MKQCLVAALLLLTLFSCKKKENNSGDSSASGLDFGSYIAYDVNGNQVELVGNTSDDYKQEDWPDWVSNLFTPLDTFSRKGFQKTDVTVRALYPNPCRDTQVLSVFANAPVNLKIAVVDNQQTVRFLKSTTVYFGQHLVKLIYNPALMEGGRNYRLFYGFSSENDAFFKKGHIDFSKLP